MAVRSTWRGAITFGMVTIPVRAYTATESKSVQFNQLHRDCGGRIRQVKRCEVDGVEVEASEIVKGYPYTKGGDYVVMNDSDFDAVRVETSKVIDIIRFVPDATIPPVNVNASYYMGPDEVGAKPFALLRAALGGRGLVAIGKWTYFQKERLVVLRLHGSAILLQTLYWADEVRSEAEISGPAVELNKGEIEMAGTLVEAMTEAEAKLDEFADEYRIGLLDIIEQKHSGGEVKQPPKSAEPKPTDDLMAALKASVERAKAAKKEPAAKGKKKAAA